MVWGRVERVKMWEARVDWDGRAGDEWSNKSYRLLKGHLSQRLYLGHRQDLECATSERELVSEREPVSIFENFGKG